MREHTKDDHLPQRSKSAVERRRYARKHEEILVKAAVPAARAKTAKTLTPYIPERRDPPKHHHHVTTPGNRPRPHRGVEERALDVRRRSLPGHTGRLADARLKSTGRGASIASA